MDFTKLLEFITITDRPASTELRTERLMVSQFGSLKIINCYLGCGWAVNVLDRSEVMDRLTQKAEVG